MARARDPFGTALNGVRARLRAGNFAPGAPLIAAELADALAISVTPLREALARLAGEGLIDDRRGWGYSAHRLDVSELEDLYRLHLIYVAGALQTPIPVDPHFARPAAFPSRPEGNEGDTGPSPLQTESFFTDLVRGGDNPALTVAFGRVSERLAVVRRAELAVFVDLRDELQRLTGLYDAGDRPGLISAVQSYHDRRIATIRAIYSAVHLEEHAG